MNPSEPFAGAPEPKAAKLAKAIAATLATVIFKVDCQPTELKDVKEISHDYISLISVVAHAYL